MNPQQPERLSMDTFLEGIWRQNPVFVMMLGMCPTLAVTVSAVNALSMGVATAFVVSTVIHDQSDQILDRVPAAGVGKRMQSDRPKQYLELAGKTVIKQTLTRLLSAGVFESVAVAISAEDPYWPELELSRHSRIVTAPGGKERADSVLSALKSLRANAEDHDWVLVHERRAAVHHFPGYSQAD